MNDVQLLFLVLAVLYVWECACWMRRSSLAIITWLGRHWHATHPGALLGNQRGGFIFAPPLPPLGTFFATNVFPLSLSPDGVLAYVATNINPGWRPTQTGRFVRFNDLRDVRANGRKLMLNGEPWLKLSSTDSARHLADKLAELAKLQPQQREKEISELIGAHFNALAVEKRWKDFQQQSKPMRTSTNALFVYLFIFAPVVIWRLGLHQSWLGLLIGLAVLAGITARLFHRAHKSLYPQAEDDRFTLSLTIALSPVTAIRALDALSRPLFETFHPLAVAKVFLPPTRFREFARRVLLDIRHPALPLCPNNDPHASAVELHARMALLKAAEQFLKSSGDDPTELCRPPEPADASCHAFCLRCGAQFTNVEANCADCGGLPLVRFAAPPVELSKGP